MITFLKMLVAITILSMAASGEEMPRGESVHQQDAVPHVIARCLQGCVDI